MDKHINSVKALTKTVLAELQAALTVAAPLEALLILPLISQAAALESDVEVFDDARTSAPE